MEDLDDIRIVYFGGEPEFAHVELTKAVDGPPPPTRVIVSIPFRRLPSETNEATDRRAKVKAKELLQAAIDKL